MGQTAPEKRALSILSDALLISILSAVGYCLTVSFQFGAEKVLHFPATGPRLDPVNLVFAAIVAASYALYIFVYGRMVARVGGHDRLLRILSSVMAALAFILPPAVILANATTDVGAPVSWREELILVVAALAVAVIFAAIVYRTWPTMVTNRVMQLAPLALSTFLVLCGFAYFLGFIVQTKAIRYEIVLDGPYRGSVVAWIAGEDYLACEANLPRHTVSHRCVLGKIDKEPLHFEQREVGPLRYQRP